MVFVITATGLTAIRSGKPIYQIKCGAHVRSTDSIQKMILHPERYVNGYWLAPTIAPQFRREQKFATMSYIRDYEQWKGPEKKEYFKTLPN